MTIAYASYHETPDLGDFHRSSSTLDYSTKMPHEMNHDTHTYVAITLSASSPFLSSPGTLASAHPGLGLAYQGQVGQLSDVHLYSIPKAEGRRSVGEVEEVLVRDLQGSDGVLHVEIQAPRQRARRGGDEL